LILSKGVELSGEARCLPFFSGENMTRLILRGILFMWCVGTIAGCATTVQEKSFQDKQVVKATRDRGVVYLALGSQWYEPLKKKPLRPRVVLISRRSGLKRRKHCR